MLDTIAIKQQAPSLLTLAGSLTKLKRSASSEGGACFPQERKMWYNAVTRPEYRALFLTATHNRIYPGQTALVYTLPDTLGRGLDWRRQGQFVLRGCHEKV